MKNLPRELAERLVPHPQTCTEQYCTCTGWLIENRFRAEAVIREAMQRAQPQWISVEEQAPPKDGSEILLRVRRAGLEGSVVAHWMPGGHCIQDHPPIDEGWYWWNKSYFDISPNPTHWMPLPEPPSTAASSLTEQETTKCVPKS